MTENMWKKISYAFGLLPLGVLFGIIAYSGHLEIKDLDLWLHMAVGKYITMYGYVPDVDFLSHTITGQPWGNHEWLFQIIIYNIFFSLEFCRPAVYAIGYSDNNHVGIVGHRL